MHVIPDLEDYYLHFLSLSVYKLWKHKGNVSSFFSVALTFSLWQGVGLRWILIKWRNVSNGYLIINLRFLICQAKKDVNNQEKLNLLSWHTCSVLNIKYFIFDI